MYYQFKLNGYTMEDLMVLNRVVAKRYRRKLTAFARIGSFIGGLVLLGTGALLLLESVLLAEDSFFFGSVLVLLGLLYLCLSIFYYRLNAWHSHRLLLKDAGEITVTLDDAGVRESGQKGESFYPYRSFIGCFHSRGRYLLFLDKKHAVILAETAIAVGDPTTFGPKLADKFGGSIPET